MCLEAHSAGFIYFPLSSSFVYSLLLSMQHGISLSLLCTSLLCKNSKLKAFSLALSFSSIFMAVNILHIYPNINTHPASCFQLNFIKRFHLHSTDVKRISVFIEMECSIVQLSTCEFSYMIWNYKKRERKRQHEKNENNMKD